MLHIHTLNRLVLLEQTFFNLPWTLSAALLASAHREVEPFRWLLVIAAFCFARTAGMSLNRLIDQEIDAANPRTNRRPLCIGLLARGEVSLLALSTGAAMVFCCYLLSPLCFMMSPLALLLIWGYSYTKRFTSFCHLFMGAISGLGPIFASAAFVNAIQPQAWLLACAVLCSISGMDIVYALQDTRFDRSFGLYSIPAQFGERQALKMARLLHCICVACLFVLALFHSWWMLLATAAVALCFLFHHNKIAVGNVDQRFFLCNVQVGLIVFAGSVLEVVTCAL